MIEVLSMTTVGMFQWTCSVTVDVLISTFGFVFGHYRFLLFLQVLYLTLEFVYLHRQLSVFLVYSVWHVSG